MALMFSRCGPPCEGGEGLSAHSTGGSIKSAVVNFWRSFGVSGQFKDLGAVATAETQGLALNWQFY